MKGNIFTGLLFLIVSNLVYGATDDSPQLVQDGKLTLTVPRVDYNDTPGFYQDAIIEYYPSEGRWHLAQAHEGVPITTIDEVELVVTEDAPIQVFLRVSGRFTNGCQELGPVHVQRADATFVVVLYYDYEQLHPGEPVACTADVRNFTTIVSLPVYGLDAGTYRYIVNDRFEGSFVLPDDNTVD